MNIHFPNILPLTTNEYFCFSLGVLFTLLFVYFFVKEPALKHRVSSMFLVALALFFLLLIFFWGGLSA